MMIYCGTRFDDLYLCELEAGHKGDHALRPIASDMLAEEVAATVHRIERVDSASTATRGDDDDDAFVLALLDSVDEVTGVWRGSELEAVELFMYSDGPTVRVTVNYGGSVTVRGTWGSSEVERVTWAGMLAEVLFEMLGGDDRREVHL